MASARSAGFPRICHSHNRIRTDDNVSVTFSGHFLRFLQGQFLHCLFRNRRCDDFFSFCLMDLESDSDLLQKFLPPG